LTAAIGDSDIDRLRLYLDTCCLNRPFDDQLQPRVRLEAEAVLLVMAEFQKRTWEWVASDVVWREVAGMPDRERFRRVMAFRIHVAHHVAVGPAILDRADEIEAMGFGGMDALHVACAEAGQVRVFLSTDDKLLRRMSVAAARLRLLGANPLSWLEEVGIP
jgi:hypothetical protein